MTVLHWLFVLIMCCGCTTVRTRVQHDAAWTTGEHQTTASIESEYRR